MKKEEFDRMVEDMYRSHMSDDDIMQIIVEGFESGEWSQRDLEIMVSWLGYSLTDEFYKQHGVKRIFDK